MTSPGLTSQQDSFDSGAFPTMTFLGHAGFDIRHGSMRLIVDPWLVGTAFDNGWQLLFPAPAFDPAGITHIWFSHEHPDHFSPPSLRLITPEHRSSITVIVQKAEDARLAEFMRTQGYKEVIEVADAAPVALVGSDGVGVGRLATLACAMGDSCHLIELDGPNGPIRMLNTNDASYDGPTGFAAALKELGADTAPIDVLISQYSYANWFGNPEEYTERKAFAEHKLDLLWMQVAGAKPKYMLPCASFIVFAHEENRYLNDAINDLGDVCQRLTEHGTTPILMSNGDTFALSEAGFAAMNAVVPAVSAQVTAEINRVRDGSRPPLTSPVVPIEELTELGNSALARLRQGVAKADYAIMGLQLRSAVFELSDHPVCLVIERVSSIRIVPKGAIAPDVLVSSAAMSYAFKNDFGFETLLVNGRFQKRRPDGEVVIRKLTGQFGYLRRKESLVGSIIDRRVKNPVLRMIRSVRPV